MGPMRCIGLLRFFQKVGRWIMTLWMECGHTEGGQRRRNTVAPDDVIGYVQYVDGRALICPIRKSSSLCDRHHEGMNHDEPRDDLQAKVTRRHTTQPSHRIAMRDSTIWTAYRSYQGILILIPPFWPRSTSRKGGMDAFQVKTRILGMHGSSPIATPTRLTRDCRPRRPRNTLESMRIGFR